jgi:hypothetical protein
MNRSPDRLNFDHLKKQAKDLIRLYRNRDAAAIARFRLALPAAARLTDGRYPPSACICMTRNRAWPASMVSNRGRT